MSTSRDKRISRLEGAILDFWLTVTLHSIPNSTVRFLDPENMRVAVGILFISWLGADIHRGGNHTPRHFISFYTASRGGKFV